MSHKSEDKQPEPTQWISNVQITGVTRKALHSAIKSHGYRSASAFFSEKAIELVKADPRKQAVGWLRQTAHLLENETI